MHRIRIIPTWDVQVRMSDSGKWGSWVERNRLADARLATRRLRLMKFNQDPWWDRCRIRLKTIHII